VNSTEKERNRSILFAALPLTERRLKRERQVRLVLGAMSGAVLAPLLLILTYLVVRAWPVLSWSLISEAPSRGMRAGGLWPAVMGTVYLVVFSLMVSAPVGILAGVYLNEFARDSWFTRLVNLAVVNLAGVPSIVHALFGFGAFVIFFGLGRCILAASFTLGIMTLPVIITATKEALAAVPTAFREACWNLGASRWQTIRTIVLPNSIGGILTGVILEVCRAAGEAAPIMFTGAVFYKAVRTGTLFPYRPTEQCMALSYHLHILSTQVPNVPEAMLYGTAVVLVGFVLVFNSSAIALRLYLRRRKKW